MNSCILMAEIIQSPELRYTSDNQMPIAEMVVQFPGLRPEDPPATMKVIGWGNLAQEIQENYHQGDRVILEGRLGMNTIDRPEGFKEKRAELTVQRIHSVGADTPLTAAPATATTASTPSASSRSSSKSSVKSPTASFSSTPEPSSQPNFDEIPF
jgi:single-stranded DNA-binding protein